MNESLNQSITKSKDPKYTLCKEFRESELIATTSKYI